MDTEPVGFDISLPSAAHAVSREYEEEIMAFACREAVPGLIRDAQTAGRWIDWSTLRIEVLTGDSGDRFLRTSASAVGRRDPVQAEVAPR